ncbi:MarR family winged helix-turn-helix transcriptional regulator [Mesobacillus maritimus]|uniref:MarR family winged helix-turn-helix transcriptional regulator n=1 Tax=Mesobacillus maritimus TaxID=1643336 RepID=UPI002559BB54|nr:MarR family transcriptional regulator [Mesobacillus maritimus]
MRETNLFKLIHMIDKINNDNIIKFTRAFPYPLGISPILVLAELKTNGTQRQVDLANKLGYTKGAMTNIATKLFDLGLAEKVFDETDRRVIQLRITSVGEKALSEAQAIGKTLFMEHFEALSEEEIHQYINIQEKLLKHIEDNK